MSVIPVLPQIARLNALISLLLGNLSAGDRMKIMTICTIDVHARDVVAKMIQTKVFGTRGNFCCTISQNFGAQLSCHSIAFGHGWGLSWAVRRHGPHPAQPCTGTPLHTLLALGGGLGVSLSQRARVAVPVPQQAAPQVENSQAFAWQSQLRHRWDDGEKHCYANICDAQLRYAYEYLGNTPRLVITPLTDRWDLAALAPRCPRHRGRATLGPRSAPAPPCAGATSP